MPAPVSGLLKGLGLATDGYIGEAVDMHIRAELAEFIMTNYLFGDTARVLRDDDNLVEEGIIDSPASSSSSNSSNPASRSRCPNPRQYRRIWAASPALPSS